jgi:methylmalonyl-CoA mutase N-terminal domain/subunit
MTDTKTESGQTTSEASGAFAAIVEAEQEWIRTTYGKEQERRQEFSTLSGLPVEPLYTPRHVADLNYLRDLGLPGQEPYVRGVHATMYRGRPWTHRQLAGYGPPEETNKRYKFLLKEGAGGINGVFDYPTLRGYDSNDPKAYADAGRGGVAIDTVEDMAILFDGIPIDEVSCSLVTCQPICNISVQSMFFANALARGIPLVQLKGTSQNDFLMETAVTISPEVLPPWFSFKLSCDAIEFCTRNVPRWNPVSFAGYNYREAGCNAIQEVGLVLCNALACSEEMLRRGLRIDDFAPRLSFFLSAQSDFFEEIAKYRAARRLWPRLLKERFHPKDERSLKFRFHVQTAGVALTAQQPLNNISRSAFHALSAVLGGAQSIHVDGYDEALCTPTELSSVTALRTQQVLDLETRVTNTVDPLGGSYFVESLTSKLEQEISRFINDVDSQGGIVKAVDNGFVHREISDSAYKYQLSIESGDTPIVGVNCYKMTEESLPCEIFRVPETFAIQDAKLKRIKENRNYREAEKALDEILRYFEANGNMMEVIAQSVRALVSEGEITNTLKKCSGTWDPPLF